jgi:hypothetical protein
MIVMQVLVVSLLLTLLGRLWYIQIYSGDKYRTEASDNRVRTVTTTAVRGQILDDMGQPFVRNRTSLVVSVDSSVVSRLKKAQRASLFAQLAVQELIAKGILASDLSPAADLIVSPSALDFGSLYLATTLDKTVSITGLSLAPDSGNVTVTAPDGFLVGAPGGAFGASLQLPYTGGRLAPTSVVVRFAPSVEQSYSGTVTVAPDSGAAKSVAVAGIGLSIPAGGTESTVVYSLTADATCAATGLATCAAESFSELYAKNYQVPSATSTTWTPSQPASTITQRVSIVGDTWTGSEIDIVPTRYIQFEVSPAAGKTWTLDAISLWAGAAGGSNLAWRIQYSKASDFSAASVLLNSTTNASYAMILQSFAPIVTLNPGETLYLRIFPWYKGASASGKYLCLQTLTIHGTAQ